MFKLNEPLLDSIEFDGKIFNLDMSFDNILDVFDVVRDDELEPEEKIYTSLSLLIGEEQTENLNIYEMTSLFSQIKEKYIQMESSNQVYDLEGNPMELPGQSKKPDFSLIHDAEMIFTSFMQAYGIDLHEEYGRMHWHKFRILLRDLPDDTKFKRVIEIRNWVPTKGTTSEERAKMRELQKIYELPDEEGGSD
mgnify:CR=1 FL=1|nr:MAG TPA: hypothetical protein [Caudoviricetes sp.]